MDEAKALSHKIIAHAKIITDVNHAIRELKSICDPGVDIVKQSETQAKFTSAVIAYSRSFTTVRGRVTYPLKDLKEHASFSRVIHDHLMEMRNKVLAHADEDAFPTNIVEHALLVDGDLPLHLIHSVSVFVYRFAGFKDEEFRAKVIRHLEACLEVANQAFGRDVTKFISSRNRKNEAERRGAALPTGTSVGASAPFAPGTYAARATLPKMKGEPNIQLADAYTYSAAVVGAHVKSVTVWNARGDRSEVLIKQSGFVVKKSSA